MKILHIGPVGYNQRASGPAQSISGLAAAQAGIGMEVGLLSSIPPDEGQRPRLLPGVCVITNRCKRHINPWRISKECFEQVIREFGRPDIVNFHSTYIPFQTAFAGWCRKLGWPYIITPRGGMTHLAQNLKKLKKKTSNLLYFYNYVKHATAIHALCEIEAQEIEQQFETKKIITVSNGVDDSLLELSSRLEPAKLDDFVNEQDLVFGFVGRLAIYHKGIDLLLDAMAIQKKNTSDARCKLFLVGPFYTKKDEKQFHAQVDSLGLNDTVKTVGPKFNEEKIRYFLSCDVFVHTSRFEGMPMAVLEAMALGKPCLVTPGTNIPDIVSAGGGWVSQPDVISIAESIKLIRSQSKDSIKDAGYKSRNLIKKDFKWTIIAKRLLEEYTKILKNPDKCKSVP